MVDALLVVSSSKVSLISPSVAGLVVALELVVLKACFSCVC